MWNGVVVQEKIGSSDSLDQFGGFLSPKICWWFLIDLCVHTGNLRFPAKIMVWKRYITLFNVMAVLGGCWNFQGCSFFPENNTKQTTIRAYRRMGWCKFPTSNPWDRLLPPLKTNSWSRWLSRFGIFAYFNPGPKKNTRCFTEDFDGVFGSNVFLLTFSLFQGAFKKSGSTTSRWSTPRGKFVPKSAAPTQPCGSPGGGSLLPGLSFGFRSQGLRAAQCCAFLGSMWGRGIGN